MKVQNWFSQSGNTGIIACMFNIQQNHRTHCVCDHLMYAAPRRLDQVYTWSDRLLLWKYRIRKQLHFSNCLKDLMISQNKPNITLRQTSWSHRTDPTLSLDRTIWQNKPNITLRQTSRSHRTDPTLSLDCTISQNQPNITLRQSPNWTLIITESCMLLFRQIKLMAMIKHNKYAIHHLLNSITEMKVPLWY